MTGKRRVQQAKETSRKLEWVERHAIIDNGLRWTNNIIHEILGNHSSVMTEETRQHLRDAVMSLSFAMSSNKIGQNVKEPKRG